MGLSNFVAKASSAVSGGGQAQQSPSAKQTAGSSSSTPAPGSGDDKIPEGANADDTECAQSLLDVSAKMHARTRYPNELSLRCWAVRNVKPPITVN